VPDVETAARSVQGCAWLEAVSALPPDDETAPGTGVTNGEMLALHARPLPDPPGATFEQGVVYGTGGGRDLTLDLFRRTDPTERQPAVVFIHGGGWGGGEPWWHMHQSHNLAARGFVTMTIRYRLADEAPWPASIEDAKCAVRWVRANADSLGVDPGRIAVAGGSAGGHLSAMVALTPGRFEGEGGHAEVSSAVDAAVLWYPATDLPRMPWPDDMLEYVRGYFGDSMEEASPVAHVSSACPPVLTMTGSADSLTTLPLIEEFHAALAAAGVPNRLEVFEGRDHAFDLFPADWPACYALLEGFLEERLKAPGASAPA
jgi:acetyl esterase/lipase